MVWYSVVWCCDVLCCVVLCGVMRCGIGTRIGTSIGIDISMLYDM